MNSQTRQGFMTKDFYWHFISAVPCNRELYSWPDHMMMSWHGHTFCITGPLCGESTGNWWISLLKGPSMEDLDGSPCCKPKYTFEQRVKWLVKWDAFTLIWCNSYDLQNSIAATLIMNNICCEMRFLYRLTFIWAGQQLIISVWPNYISKDLDYYNYLHRVSDVWRWQTI